MSPHYTKSMAWRASWCGAIVLFFACLFLLFLSTARSSWLIDVFTLPIEWLPMPLYIHIYGFIGSAIGGIWGYRYDLRRSGNILPFRAFAISPMAWLGMRIGYCLFFGFLSLSKSSTGSFDFLRSIGNHISGYGVILAFPITGWLLGMGADVLAKTRIGDPHEIPLRWIFTARLTCTGFVLGLLASCIGTLSESRYDPIVQQPRVNSLLTFGQGASAGIFTWIAYGLLVGMLGGALGYAIDRCQPIKTKLLYIQDAPGP